MDFLEKLDFMMERYGLNKRTLSIKSDIPYTTIDNWYKRGYEGIKLATLRKLSDYFNTFIDFWVLDEVTDPNYGKENSFSAEVEETQLIIKYRRLNNTGKAKLNEHLEDMLEVKKYTAPESLENVVSDFVQTAKEIEDAMPKRVKATKPE